MLWNGGNENEGEKSKILYSSKLNKTLNYSVFYFDGSCLVPLTSSHTTVVVFVCTRTLHLWYRVLVFFIMLKKMEVLCRMHLTFSGTSTKNTLVVTEQKTIASVHTHYSVASSSTPFTNLTWLLNPRTAWGVSGCNGDTLNLTSPHHHHRHSYRSWLKQCQTLAAC